MDVTDPVRHTKKSESDMLNKLMLMVSRDHSCEKTAMLREFVISPNIFVAEIHIVNSTLTFSKRSVWMVGMGSRPILIILVLLDICFDCYLRVLPNIMV